MEMEPQTAGSTGCKNIKVWTFDRSQRKGILANSFQELMTKVMKKFNVDEERRITFVLNSDGTEVDDEYFSVLSNNTIILMLLDEEVWVPVNEIGQSVVKMNPNENTEMTEKAGRMMAMVEKLKNKCKGKSLTNMRQVCTVNVGWQHYKFSQRRYTLIRSTQKSANMGPRPVALRKDMTFLQVIEELTKIFFPNGKNFLCKLKNVNTTLGNSKGEEIPRTFTVGQLIATYSKPRIYLLTKSKVIENILPKLDDSDSSSSTLPDLDFDEEDTLMPVKSSQQSNVMTPTTLSRSPSFPSTTTWQQQQQQQQSVTATRTLNQVQQQIQRAGQQSLLFLDRKTPQQSPQMMNTSRPLPDGYVMANTPTVLMRAPNANSNICSICFERDISSNIIPCNHQLCTVCAFQIKDMGQSCPHCRGVIQDIIPFAN